jgi:hypothetical protein
MISKLVDTKISPTQNKDTYASFSITVQNVGNEADKVFAVLINKAESIGWAVVSWQGTEWQLPPDSQIALRPATTIAPQGTFTAEAQIKYLTKGQYQLLAEAWHTDPVNGLSVFDEASSTITVTVTEVAPQENPLMKYAPFIIMLILLFAVLAFAASRKKRGRPRRGS